MKAQTDTKKHINLILASLFWDQSKQCRPRSDAAERGVLSGPTLFAYRNFYSKRNKNEKVHQRPLKFKMDSSNW